MAGTNERASPSRPRSVRDSSAWSHPSPNSLPRGEGLRTRASFKLAILLVCAPLVAHAAILRPATRLAGPMVLLSDLFDDAGAQASRPLGASPAPGDRLVVQAPQLAAIARQFGVDWRPGSAGDRVVLERPGEPLPEQLITGALRAALTAAGVPDGDLDMPAFATPLVPDGTTAHAIVEQLSVASETFTAGIAISEPGMDTLRLRLSGRVVATTDVPVAVRALAANVAIVPDDLLMRRIRASTLPADAARTFGDIVGLAPRRRLPEGAPLSAASLAHPGAVARGDRIAITLSVPGLLLAGGGQALDAGALGDVISVQNPTSRAVIRAVVIGPDAVRVDPGSTPRIPGRVLP